ncbi:MAG: S8 family serine peptidase [Actinomycetota bacterium]
MFKQIRPKIVLPLIAISVSAALLSPSAAIAVDAPTSSEETLMTNDGDLSVIQSDGKWAREYANEMLMQFPKLETNPYAVLVQFSEDALANEINELLDEIDAGVVEHFSDSNIYLLETVRGNVNAKNYLTESEIVEFVEFDRVLRSENISNDPRVGELWGLSGPHGIEASTAWQISSSADEVVVAVIDSGVDVSHPDLSDVIWINQNEIPENGIDDDGNGYIDDMNGWDFTTNDNLPDDGNGHGTHVAGTIAAIRNNSIGVAGVSSNVKIMALRFLDDSGNGYTNNAIAALNYAVANGAPISNNSWGGGGYSTGLYNAIEAANQAGHTFVAAAGNSGQNIDSSPSYPAAYSNTNIISVAAIRSSGDLASFSNYGSNNVDIAAPGVSILSTVSYQYCGQVNGADCYASFNGTSMASPHVAGVAALILGMRPNSSPQEISDILRDSVRATTVLNGAVAFGGELDAAQAVELSTTSGSITFPGHSNGSVVLQNEPFELTASAIRSDGVDVSADVTWMDIAGNVVGLGESLTYQSNTVGLLRLIAEVEDSSGGVIRGTATFIVEERVFEISAPIGLIEAEANEVIETSWDWDGPAGETGDLIAQSIAFGQIEGIFPMPDVSGQEDVSEFIFTIDHNETISDVELGLRFDHTYLADLNIYLIHPDGTEVLLARRDGGSQNNYGSGNQDCTGELALFTDGASQSISDGTPPYVGESRPREPFSAFAGKPSVGNWTLRIVDDWDWDQGTFYCGHLVISVENPNFIPIEINHSLSSKQSEWQVPEIIPEDKAGSYRLGFSNTSLGEAWSPGVVTLIATEQYLPPTNLNVSSGNAEVVVSWDAPESGNVESYLVTGQPEGTCSSTSTSCVVTGLTNGRSYTFTVQANYVDGEQSIASVVSSEVTPATVPSAPTGVEATATSNEATITWSPSVDDGGLEIIRYKVTSEPEGYTCTSANMSCSITGLSNGTSYVFTVVASNAVGDSQQSLESNAVVPLGVPDSPNDFEGLSTSLTEVQLTWDAPQDGGALIELYEIQYRIIQQPEEVWSELYEVSGDQTLTNITELEEGTGYEFRIRAYNAIGFSSWAFLTMRTATLPAAPNNLLAIPSDSSVTLYWDYSSPDNESSIDEYLVVSSPSGVSCSTSEKHCTIRGLENGTAYTFSVSAINSIGQGPSSESTSPVIPNLTYGSQIDLLSIGTPDGPKPGDNFGMSMASGDFNGDGLIDLATGAAHSSISGKPQAGSVYILDGSFNWSITSIITQDSAGLLTDPEEGDSFGYSLETGDFDGDGFDDLAIGAPYEDLGGNNQILDAGLVTILYGSPSGLSEPETFHQYSSGIGTRSESGDLFGYSLASGDINGDSYDDLVIGVPGEGIARQDGAGAAHVIYGSPTGLNSETSDILHQYTRGLRGRPETNDSFGEAIDVGNINGDIFEDIVIGVPGETVGWGSRTAYEAGGLHILYGSQTGITGYESDWLYQNAPNWPGRSENNDRFASSISIGDIDEDGLGDLAVGVPGEKLGPYNSAGQVQIIYNPGGFEGNSTFIQTIFQNASGVKNRVESGDRFGEKVILANLTEDSSLDLIVGIPGESISGKLNAGAVSIFPGLNGSISTGNDLILYPYQSSIDGNSQTDATFGQAIEVSNQTLFVGSPGKDVDSNPGAGAIYYFSY